MTSKEKRFIKNLTQSERERYKKLGIPLAVAAKFEVRPDTNFPIPTSDCHGYQIACLCGKECPKFNEAYNSHFLDYRGLIKKGLAFEAPKGMYAKTIKQN